MYKDVVLEVPPGVFHPGFFFSTRLLATFLSTAELKGKQVLELGAGSGLLSILAAKKGALVTAVDINPTAVTWLQKNAVVNGAEISIVQSDLFANVSGKFDLVLINPPFYKKTPVTDADHAWYCGEHGEYFEALFAALLQHVKPGGETVMVLSDGCDLQMIGSIAAKHGLELDCFVRKGNIFENLFLFRVKPKHL